jgi:two-component system, OmpR family, response regulator CpxR
VNENLPQSFPPVGVPVTCFRASDVLQFSNPSSTNPKIPSKAIAPASGREIPGGKMRPKRTILCVDDNEQALSIRKLMLETRGYRVLACSNGHQALETFKQGGIDLVLSDLQMPGLDGAELVDKIKEISAGTPAILFSGKTRFYEKDTRADLFLPKGMYAPIELLERIRLMLVKKRGPKRLNHVEPPRMSVAS